MVESAWILDDTMATTTDCWSMWMMQGMLLEIERKNGEKIRIILRKYRISIKRDFRWRRGWTPVQRHQHHSCERGWGRGIADERGEATGAVGPQRPDTAVFGTHSGLGFSRSAAQRRPWIWCRCISVCPKGGEDTRETNIGTCIKGGRGGGGDRNPHLSCNMQPQNQIKFLIIERNKIYARKILKL